MKRISAKRMSRRSLLAGAGAAAAGLTIVPRLGWSAEEAKLNFYNWDTYIGETTLDDFKAATGIEVKMDLFADNDELFAKLKEGNPGYDVIVPTNDYVERMITADMLEPLDHSKIPNMANITPVFRDAAFDPGAQAQPALHVGDHRIGYRKSKVSATPESWKHLYDSDEYSGRIAMLGDGSTIVGIGLKYLGYSLQRDGPGPNQGGRGARHPAEAAHQGVRRGQRPGPPHLRRSRPHHGVERGHPPGHGRGRRSRLFRSEGRRAALGDTLAIPQGCAASR